jgi:hypothetical protein
MLRRVGSGELDDRAAQRQAQVLRALAARLEGGEGEVPTDVFHPIEEELDRRVDEQALAEAWAEAGGGEGEPWPIVRDRLPA